jgi:hypothetical protein
MPTSTVTPGAVLNAIRAGAQEVIALAEVFGVVPTSHTLRQAVTALERNGDIVISPDYRIRIA